MMKKEELKLVSQWDKTFPQSDKVNHSKYTDNKELMIIPDAVHTDLYDNLDVIPFEYIEEFIRKYM